MKAMLNPAVIKHLNYMRTGEKPAKKGSLRTIYKRICKFCGHDKAVIKTNLKGETVYRCTRCNKEVNFK